LLQEQEGINKTKNPIDEIFAAHLRLSGGCGHGEHSAVIDGECRFVIKDSHL
jgi:hypothetical protein